MQISVSGKHVDVGQALRSHVESRAEETIHKYLDRVTDVNVVFSKEGYRFRASIVINTGTHAHLVISSHAEAGDAYACFDAALEKSERQLRRYKGKLKDHHKEKPGEIAMGLDGASGKAVKHYTISGDQEMADEVTPLVIAEKKTEIERLSVSEAVMKLDLSDLPALMFINRSHGGLNVIYRRPDGHISWVDVEDNAA